jgi:hypothetical protein
MRRFTAREIEAFDKARIIGVRSGETHRYTGVWPVVVEGRVFVRPWTNKATGWYAAFGQNPAGSAQVGEVEIPVQGRQTRSATTAQAVSRAFAAKYNTRASEKWVQGFAEPEREKTTLELVPGDSSG